MVTATLVQLWKLTMKIDYSNYEIVAFQDVTSNQRTKRQGLKIGQYLIVAGAEKQRKIFRLKQGLPLIDVLFTELEDAVRVAEWLDSLFGDYWQIWDAYPELDVFALFKWTISDGLKIYEAIQRLPKRAKLDDVTNALSEAEDYVSEWTRGIG